MSKCTTLSNQTTYQDDLEGTEAWVLQSPEKAADEGVDKMLNGEAAQTEAWVRQEEGFHRDLVPFASAAEASHSARSNLSVVV